MITDLQKTDVFNTFSVQRKQQKLGKDRIFEMGEDPMPILCQTLAIRTLVLPVRSMLEAFRRTKTNDEGRI